MTQVWPAVFKIVIIQRQKLEAGSFPIKNQSAPLVLWVTVTIIESAVNETSLGNSTKKNLRNTSSHSCLQDEQSKCVEQNYSG